MVGHSLTVITLQAGVALHLLERSGADAGPPADLAASLEAIRSTSKDALAELRTTLGVFATERVRDDPGLGPEEVRAPRLGLARLGQLVGALRSAGRAVEVRTGAWSSPEPLPAAVDQAAFRIIQEALTNVVRHAGPATATVTLERSEDALRIAVTNDGPPPAGWEEGHGIRGMRERAAAVGGTLEVRPADPGGLAVHAVLPLVRVPV